MNKIQLRTLSVFSLNQIFARKISDTKIRHYIVSTATLILNGPEKVEKALIDQIRSEDPVTEIEFIKPSKPILRTDNTLTSKDVTDKVLGRFSLVKRALKKKKVSSAIHVYTRVAHPNEFLTKELTNDLDELPKISLLHKIKLYTAYYTNKIGFISNFLYEFQDKYLNYHKEVAPVRYLSYAYDESNEKEAFRRLKKDLKILHKNKLILGHLALPTTIVLADTVGSGDNKKALFCFVFVDCRKMTKMFNVDILNMPNLCLKQYFNIESEGYEGALSCDLSKKYEIEEVQIVCNTQNSFETWQKSASEEFERTKAKKNKPST